jgi:DMSO/TMAO reductase YedYZ molybdopterin-dependent catalytic subunit
MPRDDTEMPGERPQPARLDDLYAADPEAAERKLFGRIPYPDRRGFLKGAGLAAMTAAVGAHIPFHRFMPSGLVPAAFAQGGEAMLLDSKQGLVVLNERPINAETPPHLLDDETTPAEHFFVRNNGLVPQAAIDGNAEGWTLTIDGLVDSPMDLTLDQLRNDYEPVTLALQLECGGNGRSFFQPGASGNQWTFGAVGNAEWTGVRLRDLLNAAGVQDGAVYTAHYGADMHLSGDPSQIPISRGVPIDKAMEEHTLVAYAMNGGDIPALNGFPLRVVAPGWPGSCSQKWLTRIQVRDQVHDGPKMGGYSYRVPAYPVAPGVEVPEEDMVIIESMPVKSLITAPETGAAAVAGEPLAVRGHAWAGDHAVAAMHVSLDFGQTWQEAELDAPRNRYDWQRWRAEVTPPIAGYYEVWARATDDTGRMQPAVVPGWNPRGYLNNMIHRIAVFAA